MLKRVKPSALLEGILMHDLFLPFIVHPHTHTHTLKSLIVLLGRRLWFF